MRDTKAYSSLINRKRPCESTRRIAHRRCCIITGWTLYTTGREGLCYTDRMEAVQVIRGIYHVGW